MSTKESVVPGRKEGTYRVLCPNRAESKKLVGTVIHFDDTPLRISKVRSYDTKAFRALVDAVPFDPSATPDPVPSDPTPPDAPDVDPEDGGEDGGTPVSQSVVPEMYRKKYGKDGNCGDDVAGFLSDFDPSEVLEEAVNVGLIVEGQYDHVNPGMGRMNVGNRIRGKIRRTPVGQVAITFFETPFMGEAPAEEK